jgi:hypothetical protein
MVAIIVSVLPVPVGITIVAGSFETVLNDFIAKIAPNCADRKPLIAFSLSSCMNTIGVSHVCNISSGESQSSVCPKSF